MDLMHKKKIKKIKKDTFPFYQKGQRIATRLQNTGKDYWLHRSPGEWNLLKRPGFNA